MIKVPQKCLKVCQELQNCFQNTRDHPRTFKVGKLPGYPQVVHGFLDFLYQEPSLSGPVYKFILHYNFFRTLKELMYKYFINIKMMQVFFRVSIN